MRLASATFANACLNWAPSPNPDLVRSVKDGLYMQATKFGLDAEITLDLLHTRGPVLCVVSRGAHLIKPSNTTTVQASRHNGDVFHTVLQFEMVRLLPKDVIQVILLHGSSTVLGGTTLTLREVHKVPVEYRIGRYVETGARPA